jgi:exopolysaccharide production protein ExoY
MTPHPAIIRLSRPTSYNSVHYAFQKRVLDLSCCVLALPILIVSSALLALHMALTSPGPIFFRQERIGLRGRKFNLFKFRTMQVRSETDSHRAYFAKLVRDGEVMQKLDARGDARLIAGGWLLRSSGLDELPQIINVLRGEMSIVGPRPCLPYEYEHYSTQQRQRFNCMPGLTGLWQVSGKNRTTFEEMVRMDIDYTRQNSIALDLKIVALTIPALLTQVNDTRAARTTAGHTRSYSNSATIHPSSCASTEGLPL